MTVPLSGQATYRRGGPDVAPPHVIRRPQGVPRSPAEWPLLLHTYIACTPPQPLGRLLTFPLWTGPRPPSISTNSQAVESR